MVRILIAVCLLAVRKINSVKTDVSFVVEAYGLPPQNYRQPHQEQNQGYHPPPPRLFQNPPNINVPQREPQSVINHNSDLPLQPTVRVNQPRPHLFISRVVPEKMERPALPKDANRDGNRPQHRSDVLDKVDTEKPALRSNHPTSASHDETTKFIDAEANPETNINVTVPANITLDERANFDGDQCPAGYVRVNGKCVEKD